MNSNSDDIKKNSFLFLQNFTYYDTYRKQFENPEVEDYESWLNDTFFSRENVNKIQTNLKQKIYEKSKNRFNISPQKDEHIYQIMKGIYNDHCQHLPYNLKEQIIELNMKVVEFSYPYVLRNIEAYFKYQEFANSPIKPLPPPQSVSTAGKRTLPSTFLPFN